MTEKPDLRHGIAECIAAVELAGPGSRHATRVAANLASPLPGAADVVADRRPLIDGVSARASTTALVRRVIAQLDT